LNLSELLNNIRWDMRINRGVSFDSLRAKLLLIEVRIEQYICQKFLGKSKFRSAIWYLCRFLGSIFQWFLCNSNIPGTITIGRGLRLPHPQNIILAGYAEIGEFCTIYHNVSIAWNGFEKVKPLSPKIGDCVLLGAGTIIIGDLTIGSYVLVGAGTIVTKSIPSYSRVTGPHREVSQRFTSEKAAKPGSKRHLENPYNIWR